MVEDDGQGQAVMKKKRVVTMYRHFVKSHDRGPLGQHSVLSTE